MKTIVISLEEEKERRSFILNELKINNIENTYLMDAVNGANIKEHVLINTPHKKISILSYKDQIRYYDSSLNINGKGLLKGDMGCSWSHLNIYEMLIKDEHNDVYMVLEDDAQFVVSPTEFNNFLKNLPTPDSYDICHIFSSEFYEFNKIKQINSHYWIPERNFFNNASGYIVTKEGAKKLLSAVYPLMGLPADDLLSNLYIFSKDFRVIVPYKNLLKAKGFNSSTARINNNLPPPEPEN